MLTRNDEIFTDFDGTIVRPHDAAYDEARSVWNGMIDKYPAVIAQCATTGDVVAAVNAARKHNLPLAVRGGGHNVAGQAVCDDGLVIDLSRMNDVQVDPDTQIAYVQGGATWAAVDKASQAHGLATPGGVVSITGVGGLTLGGSVGWLRNKYGLTCDNLVGAKVVTADGHVIHASEDEHTDLFWALRGGGGNFGIVTTFEFQLHQVGPELMMAFVFQPAEGDKLAEALRFYREYVSDAPDEVTSFAICGTIPPGEETFPEEIHGEEFVLFAACYAGDVAAGRDMLQPLRDYDTPLIDLSEPMPYTTIQTLLDEDYPEGDLHYFWKSLYLNELSDEAIEQIVKATRNRPSVLSTVDVWHVGGAVKRVPADAMAFGPRSASFLLGVEANWEPAEDDESNIAWTRHSVDAMQPYSDGSQYLNFPGFLEEGGDMLKTTFGANYQRLVKVKTAYDPENIFRFNQNIKPEQRDEGR